MEVQLPIVRGWVQYFVANKLLSRAKAMRRSQFEQLPAPTSKVVFLGDSITDGGHWHEWFPGVDVVNRGIVGDSSQEVLDRLDSSVTGAKAVFLLIGTNDLSLRIGAADITATVAEIVAGIAARAPGAPIFLQSVMPRAAKARSRVAELNEAYRRLADSAGLTYIDLWPALADGRGELRAEYTLDKLHLVGRGYQVWADLLRPHVEQFAVEREAVREA